MPDLRRDVDACLMPSLPDTTLRPELAEWMAGGLGAVILFGANIRDRDQVGELAAQMRQHAPDLLIGVDEESGDVTRMERTTGSSYPGAQALGAVDDVALTERVGESLADLLAGAGINLNFAPVADVNSNAANPVIGSRSFGSDPQLVARHVAAMVAGLQSWQVASCAKHFPGHGAAAADSHTELPVIDRPADALAAVDLAPFRAAIEAGIKAVMSAHVVYPVWDPDAPATTSARVLTELLRGELGFTGVVVTDALHMSAIRNRIGVPEGAVRALAAGADLLCISVDWDEQQRVRAAVLDAVGSGRLPEQRVRESAARVRALQQWAKARPRSDWTAEVGVLAARRALLVDAVAPRATPYVVDAGIRVRPGVGVASGSLLDELSEMDDRVRGVVLTEAPADPFAAVDAAGDAPLVVVVRDAQQYPWQQELIAAGLKRPQCTVVSTGMTHDHVYAPGHYVAAQGCGRANLHAAAEFLLGRVQ
ncbi:MAG TPA: beta-N-acetylhexosaminidase [Mycobacteriales bacterium]|nr:beta-N-acetylhexosaminidase [Mycobacteriales bacterium]